MGHPHRFERQESVRPGYSQTLSSCSVCTSAYPLLIRRPPRNPSVLHSPCQATTLKEELDEYDAQLPDYDVSAAAFDELTAEELSRFCLNRRWLGWRKLSEESLRQFVKERIVDPKKARLPCYTELLKFERNELAELAKLHGFTRDQIGFHKPHMTVGKLIGIVAGLLKIEIPDDEDGEEPADSDTQDLQVAKAGAKAAKGQNELKRVKWSSTRAHKKAALIPLDGDFRLDKVHKEYADHLVERWEDGVKSAVDSVNSYGETIKEAEEILAEYKALKDETQPAVDKTVEELESLISARVGSTDVTKRFFSFFLCE
ncbi:hypothetical protein DL93DRAFT_221446 [Clavulina sp. PMI_390]|nr:hypothetical protein DL93DRAFT_221446 [Clavulina sp. PMI_390]